MCVCPSCKKQKLILVDGDDGVPILMPFYSDECVKSMQEHKEDVYNIFEEWECPNYIPRF